MTHERQNTEYLQIHFIADEDTDNLEKSIRRSKEDYLKKVEIFKGLRTIQKSQWQDGESLPKEENWDELNSKVQDFLQQRRLSKKVNIQECKISYSYLIFYILRMLTVKTRKEGRDRVNSVTFSHILYMYL